MAAASHVKDAAPVLLRDDREGLRSDVAKALRVPDRVAGARAKMRFRFVRRPLENGRPIGRSQWQVEQDKRSLGRIGNANRLLTAFFGSRPVAGSRIEKDDPDGE